MKGDHRRPPDPPHWETPAGSCRWCGCCIYHERGPDKGKPALLKHWHSRCVKEYKFIFWPQETRSVLWKKQEGLCGDCQRLMRDPIRWGFNGSKLVPEHHHIIPLVDYIHDPLDPYAAWKEGNLVLLCHACHQERHRLLRLEKKPQMRLAI